MDAYVKGNLILRRVVIRWGRVLFKNKHMELEIVLYFHRFFYKCSSYSIALFVEKSLCCAFNYHMRSICVLHNENVN